MDKEREDGLDTPKREAVSKWVELHRHSDFATPLSPEFLEKLGRLKN